VKLFLFDIDQTLINSGGAGLRALNRACHKLLSIENAVEGITPHGKTDPAIIREIFLGRLGNVPATEKQVSEILESYLEFLKDEVRQSPTYRVLPGILEVLEDLGNRRDVVFGLATGNIERGARIKLERGELNSYFEFGGFGSDSEQRAGLVRVAAEAGRKRCGHPIPAQKVWVIGDTPRDIEAGREAGFQTIGVATGSYSVDQLSDSGASIAISDFQSGRDHFFRSTFIE
jgi:phosphoglycolate phosphatase